MPTFATPRPVTATMEAAGARVRVTASDRTDTVVLVEPIDSASRKDIKVAAKTTVQFTRGQLSAKTTSPGDKNGSVAIAITVRGAAVEEGDGADGADGADVRGRGGQDGRA
jgi:hypothetical protein